MEGLINKWKKRLNIEDWEILTDDISNHPIEYNGESYFVGIYRDFDIKQAVIHHDVPLTEECIIHELLHIVFPEPQEDETYQDYERWITEAAKNLSEQG